MDMPKHLEWYLTQEGVAKMKADLDKMASLVREACDIGQSYGLKLTVQVKGAE